METKDSSLWRNLFVAIPDETLPDDFPTKVMDKIRAKMALRKKMNRFWEISGVAAGIVVMLITCVIVVYNMDISFRFPEIEPLVWTFPTFDFKLFTSPSFRVSFQIGILAVLLLMIDSTIRGRIERGKRGKG